MSDRAFQILADQERDRQRGKKIAGVIALIIITPFVVAFAFVAAVILSA